MSHEPADATLLLPDFGYGLSETEQAAGKMLNAMQAENDALLAAAKEALALIESAYGGVNVTAKTMLRAAIARAEGRT